VGEDALVDEALLDGFGADLEPACGVVGEDVPVAAEPFLFLGAELVEPIPFSAGAGADVGHPAGDGVLAADRWGRPGEASAFDAVEVGEEVGETAFGFVADVGAGGGGLRHVPGRDGGVEAVGVEEFEGVVVGCDFGFG
jgi:hypothetical protein